MEILPAVQGNKRNEYMNPKIEYYCVECDEFKGCDDHICCLRSLRKSMGFGGKPEFHRASITCAATGCNTRIVYPAGTRHPKYCQKHIRTKSGMGAGDEKLYR